MFLSGTAAVKHIVKPWIRTQHQVNKNETRVGMVLHTQIGKTAWFSTDQRDAIWRAFSYSNPWVGLCWAASYLLCNKLQRVGFSIPFKILTEKVNPVDFSKCVCVWGGAHKEGGGASRTYGKEINIYRHQHWSLTSIYNSSSGRLRAESTFFPLCKIINTVK